MQQDLEARLSTEVQVWRAAEAQLSAEIQARQAVELKLRTTTVGGAPALWDGEWDECTSSPGHSSVRW